jgi:FAD/FMN-containing dehydrogenase
MMGSTELREELMKVVGTDRFYDDPEILEVYSRDHSFVPPRKPLGVVKPDKGDQIKKIIDLANETLVNLIPISSGFPKFFGDTIPTCPGIVMDLSDLSKVVRVDRRNKVAIIEPGVTFGKLRAALEKEGLVPYTPLLPRSTKSVLASALEREPITVPKDHWDFNDPIAGGEVVIGDGHIQGFGDSAGHTREELESGKTVPVIPLGPSSIGWLNMVQGAQGTLGIVSWASVRCRMKPSIQKPFFIAAQDLKDILPFMQMLLKRRFSEELFILNGFSLASVLSEEAEGIKRLQSSLPSWILFFNIAGYARYPEKEIGWKEEQAMEMAAKEGNEVKEAVGGVSALKLLRALEKTADKDRRLRFKDSCQIMPFSTTLDKTPELTASVMRIAGDDGYSPADIGIYIQPVIQGCQCQCEVFYPYNPTDKQEVEKVRNLYMATAEELSHMGAYYSRPYGMLADITYQDREIVNVLRKIKNILDPNDILNSGKIY